MGRVTSRDPAAPSNATERELNEEGIFTNGEAGEITTRDGRTLHFDARSLNDARVLVWEHDARDAWERYALLATEVAALFYTPLEARVVGALLQVPECEGYALLVPASGVANYLGDKVPPRMVCSVLERLADDGGIVTRHVPRKGGGGEREALWGVDFAQLAAVVRMRLGHMLKDERVAGADAEMCTGRRREAEQAECVYRCVGCKRRYSEIDLFPEMVDCEHNVRCVTHGCNDVLVDERDEVDRACLANDAAESAVARRLVRGELQHLKALVDSAQALPAPRTLSPEEESVLEERRRRDVDRLMQHRASCAAEEERRAYRRAQGAHEMPSFLQGGSARAAERSERAAAPPLPLLSGSDDDDDHGGDDEATPAHEHEPEPEPEPEHEHEHAYVREEYDASTDRWTRYCECGFSETFERM